MNILCNILPARTSHGRIARPLGDAILVRQVARSAQPHKLIVLSAFLFLLCC